MKRLILCILVAFSISSIVPVIAGSQKKADKETFAWRYEVQDLNYVAKDGKSVIFKIWSYSKKSNTALMQAGKNAVHAVIFKQISNNPPLAGTSTLESDYEEFFKNFFSDGGSYMRFITFANNGAIAPEDNIKLEKEYKIGVTVTVNRADLRKYLEEQGVITSMNSLF